MGPIYCFVHSLKIKKGTIHFKGEMKMTVRMLSVANHQLFRPLCCKDLVCKESDDFGHVVMVTSFRQNKLESVESIFH